MKPNEAQSPKWTDAIWRQTLKDLDRYGFFDSLKEVPVEAK